ncbi:MAG: hypothetical protein GYA20_04825 [Chloroflexi bacterium]|nr:hypothetical protein [Chloroflexota bacterium]
MPKDFITERDIEDMVKRGILSLEINDQVVLTDLAYEKANRLGMRLVSDRPENPPAAPVRPYVAQQPRPVASALPASTPAIAPVPAPAGATQIVQPAQVDGEALQQRVRNAVIARLGSQVDANLVDVIIKRVLQNVGIK